MSDVVLSLQKALHDANARITELERERDEARQWVRDLQSGMYVNCVYCGHRYGPGETTPVSMADALKAHVEQCPRHPMSELKHQRDTAMRALRAVRDDMSAYHAIHRHVRAATAVIDRALADIEKGNADG